MSVTIISGTLLLNSDLYCDGNITITPYGVVTPIPDPELMKTYYSYQSNSYITANGGNRAMTSTTGGIIVNGLIDGKGAGFESNRGPGCNSILQDSSGNVLQGYGASHAGMGAIIA